MKFFRTALLPAVFVALSSAALAQTAHPAPMQAPMSDHGTAAPGQALASPPAVAETMLDGKGITIHYNRPSIRGRVIMGGLVPYGQVWRTGANPATSLFTAANLKIGDLKVTAGKYTLYTLPAAPGEPWKLIVNMQVGQWGTVYNQDKDLGRVTMQSRKLAPPQEMMSISFENTTKTSTELHVKWETTDEWVRIEAAK